MKVYLVWAGEYEDRGVVAAYATEKLAEDSIASDLRERYDQLVVEAGRPIPRQGFKDGKGGIIGQVVPPPPPFDDWCRQQESQWAEEIEVEGAGDGLLAKLRGGMADGWMFKIDDPPANTIQTVVQDEKPRPDGTVDWWNQRYDRTPETEDGAVIYRFVESHKGPDRGPDRLIEAVAERE